MAAGQIARYLATGERESRAAARRRSSRSSPSSTRTCSRITASRIGRRHARKHLGWALDAAAATAGAPVELAQGLRARVC